MPSAQARIHVTHRNADGEVIADPWPARHCPLAEWLKPGDGVLDLGANVGEFARGFAEVVGSTGYVVAVEPDPYSATVCASLAASMPWVHVVPCAVADRAGVVPLHRDAKNARRQSLWQDNLTNPSEDVILVAALPLDVLAAAVPNLAAIKVDVQGAEAVMLTGGPDTLRRTNLTWYTELWPLGLSQAGASIEQVVGTFKAHGWIVAARFVGYERQIPSRTSWEAVLEQAHAKPEGVQNVVLRHTDHSPETTK